MSELFGKYELIKSIAAGQVAEVFLARDTESKDDSLVALKRLVPVQMDNPLETLRAYAGFVTDFEHPNLTTLLELGKEGDNLFVAMEYTHGKDLNQTLARGRLESNPLPMNMAVTVISRAAAGLAYAHETAAACGHSDAVHRDVSPQNILVGTDGEVKLSDFGVASAEERFTRDKDDHTQKLGYMSPEQFEQSKLDDRSDIYSLAVVLFEATTGEKFFNADTDIEIIELMTTGQTRSPSEVLSTYPADLEEIVLKGVAHQAKDRFVTAQEFHEALEEWLEKNMARARPVHIARYMRALFPELTESPDADMEDADKTVVSPAPADAAEEDEFSADSTLVIEVRAHEHDVKESKAKPKEAVPKIIVDFGEVPPKADKVEAAPQEEVEAPKPLPKLSLKAPPPSALPGPPKKRSIPAPKAPEPEATPTPGPVEEITSAPDKTPVESPTPSAAAPVHAGPPKGRVPAGPPAGGRPPQRKPASTPDPAPAPAPVEQVADLGVEDWTPKKGKTGLYAALGLAAAVLVGIGIFVASTSGENELEKELETWQVDPALLEVDDSKPVEKVTVPFETVPAGGHFVVNGAPAKLVDGGVELTKGKKNEVIAFLKGHKPQIVHIAGSASTSFFTLNMDPLDLEGPMASLAITSELRDAKIMIDGKYAGLTPNTISDLRADVEHHVYVEKEGRYAYSGLITLVPESENIVEAPLPKLDGGHKNYVTVRYTAIPKGATVKLNGELLAMTPFTKRQPRGLHLAIEFNEADHSSMTRYLSTETVGTLELRPFLDELKREEGTISISLDPPGGTLYVANTEHGTEGVENLKLKAGMQSVVVEHLGQRIRTKVQVVPKTHTKYVLKISGGKIAVVTK